MLLKHTFILGGASSGKSAFAESLVVATAAPKIYVATAQVYDDEMRTKIAAHRDSRGEGWHTIESPMHTGDVLANMAQTEVALLDCATMWLSNHLLADSDVAAETAALIKAIGACKGRVVTVSNEVGMGVVPDNALARRFRDAQGKLNQKLAASADLAVFVVAGLPLVLKGSLP